MSNFVDLNDLDAALGQVYSASGGQGGPGRIANQTAQAVAEAAARRAGQASSFVRDQPLSAFRTQVRNVVADAQAAEAARRQAQASKPAPQAQAPVSTAARTTTRTSLLPRPKPQLQADIETARRAVQEEDRARAAKQDAARRRDAEVAALKADQVRRKAEAAAAEERRVAAEAAAATKTPPLPQTTERNQAALPQTTEWNQAASIAAQQMEWNRASALPTTQARPVQPTRPAPALAPGQVVWTSPHTPHGPAEDAPDYLFNKAVEEANAAEEYEDYLRMRADSEAEQNATVAARRKRVDDELNAQARARAERIRASQPPAERGEYEQKVLDLAAKLENQYIAVRDQVADELITRVSEGPVAQVSEGPVIKAADLKDFDAPSTSWGKLALGVFAASALYCYVSKTKK